MALDLNQPYGIVNGNVGRARYVQNGVYYDVNGVQLSAAPATSPFDTPELAEHARIHERMGNVVTYSKALTGGSVIGESGAGVVVGGDIDYRAFGSWLLPNQDIGANWQNAIDQLDSGQNIVFGQGTFQFSKGAVSRRRIGIKGSGFGTHINFIPSLAKDTWMTWDGLNAAAAEVTDELQLNGAIVRDLKLRSDRTVRANALRFRKCDNVDIRNIFSIGMAGSSLVMDRCREFSIHGFRTRFNGYLDASNPHLSDPDWAWRSPPTWYATLVNPVVGSGSAQTISLSSLSYVDQDGIIQSLSVGASFTIDDGTGTAQKETVTVLSMDSSAKTVSAVVTKNHAADAECTISGDNTNFSICHDVKLIFPFWDALQIDDTASQTVSGVMIHMLPSGSSVNGTNLEGNVVRYFGGSKGFTGGVPNNIYAAIHKPITGNETSVTGLEFDKTAFAWASGVNAVKSKKLRISDGIILGGGTNYVVRAEDNGVAANSNLETLFGTEVYLSNLDISAAGSDITSLYGGQQAAKVSADASTDILTATHAGTGDPYPVPPTGYPIQFVNSTGDANLPAGLLGYGQPMYVIRVTTTTFRVALSRRNALKGVYVDITTAGSGQSYAKMITGAPISASNGAKVFVDPTVRLGNGFQAFVRDSWPSSPVGTAVLGLPSIDTTFSAQQSLPFVHTSFNPNSSFAGTTFGISGEKFGFFGAAPVQQPASASQAAATDAATTMALANALRSALVSLGLIKGSA